MPGSYTKTSARASRPRQLGLDLRTHGGARKGAGRKPAGARAGVSHHGRDELTGREPVHVTLRVREHVWNLRSRRSHRVFQAGLAGVATRSAHFRVVHYSLQGNHVHLVVEAAHGAALANGLNALSARFARGMNRLMGATGKVLADRYHAHVLRTPREVRNALAYVLGNFASHARRRGEHVAAAPDAFASAAPLALPRTWLLRAAPA